MSMNPHGILAYGYDLGGPDYEWKLEEYQHYQLDLPWYEGTDFVEQAEKKLFIEILGFNETWDDDYINRLDNAKSEIGLTIVEYGTYDYPGYVLAPSDFVFKSDDYGANVVKLEVPPNSRLELLDRALKILSITPTQEKPEWILASFYG